MRSVCLASFVFMVSGGALFGCSDDPVVVPQPGNDAAVDVASSQDGTIADTSTADTGAIDASSDVSATFALTSTSFVEGAAIPVANSCKGPTDDSPPLTWTGAPAGVLSYAVTLTGTFTP
ncbi:hypothetical protein BH09MYX1_BH09MYX1_04880 [soil metagenome]